MRSMTSPPPAEAAVSFAALSEAALFRALAASSASLLFLAASNASAAETSSRSVCFSRHESRTASRSTSRRAEGERDAPEALVQGFAGGGETRRLRGGEGRGSRIVSVVRGVPRFRRAGAKKRRRGVRWVRAPWREATGCARGRAGVFARVRVVARDGGRTSRLPRTGRSRARVSLRPIRLVHLHRLLHVLPRERRGRDLARGRGP